MPAYAGVASEPATPAPTLVVAGARRLARRQSAAGRGPGLHALAHRLPVSLRPRGRPVCRRARGRLRRQRDPLRLPQPRRRRARPRRRPVGALGGRHRARQRLADRPGARLPRGDAGPRRATLFTIHNLAFQGEFDRRRGRPRTCREAWLERRGRAPLGPDLDAEGGAALRRRPHHREPDLRARDPDARRSAAASTACCACAPIRCTACSTASTRRSGTRPATRSSPARYGAGGWAAKARNKAALQSRCGLDVDAARAAVRDGQPADRRKRASTSCSTALERLVGQGAQLVVPRQRRCGPRRALARGRAGHPRPRRRCGSASTRRWPT